MKNMTRIVLKRGFQLPRVKFSRDEKGGRESLGVVYCS